MSSYANIFNRLNWLPFNLCYIIFVIEIAQDRRLDYKQDDIFVRNVHCVYKQSYVFGTCPSIFNERVVHNEYYRNMYPLIVLGRYIFEHAALKVALSYILREAFYENYAKECILHS